VAALRLLDLDEPAGEGPEAFARGRHLGEQPGVLDGHRQRPGQLVRDLDVLQGIHEKSRVVVAFSLIATPKSGHYTQVRDLERLSPPQNSPHRPVVVVHAAHLLLLAHLQAKPKLGAWTRPAMTCGSSHNADILD